MVESLLNIQLTNQPWHPDFNLLSRHSLAIRTGSRICLPLIKAFWDAEINDHISLGHSLSFFHYQIAYTVEFIGASNIGSYLNSVKAREVKMGSLRFSLTESSAKPKLWLWIQALLSTCFIGQINKKAQHITCSNYLMKIN